MSKFIDIPLSDTQFLTVAMNYSPENKDYYGYLMGVGQGGIDAGIWLGHAPSESELQTLALVAFSHERLTEEWREMALLYPKEGKRGA